MLSKVLTINSPDFQILPPVRSISSFFSSSCFSSSFSYPSSFGSSSFHPITNFSSPSFYINNVSNNLSKIGSVYPNPQKKVRLSGVFWSTNVDKGKKSCPYCTDDGIVVYDERTGDQLCCECGFVLEGKVMSDEQEWRSFQTESCGGTSQEKNRVGGPNDQWLESQGHGTLIVGGTKKITNMHCNTTKMNCNDKLLKKVFAQIQEVALAFSLSNIVVERSKAIAKDLQERSRLRNRTSITHVLACVYIACRDASMSRTIKELACYNNIVTEKELGNAVSSIRKIIGNEESSRSESDIAYELMARVCNRLQLSKDVTNLSLYIAKSANEKINRAMNPHTAAAASLYFAVLLHDVKHITRSQIASITDVAASSIKKLYKILLECAHLVLPSDFKPVVKGGVDALKDENSNVDKKRKLDY